MKKTLNISLSVLLALGLAGCSTSTSSAASSAASSDSEGTVLRSFVLTSGFSAENQINLFDLNEDVQTYVLNIETREFEAAELSEEAIRGNFVALIDTNEDEKADVVQIVNYADADSYWDPEMTWCDGAGTADPGIDDETGYAVFGQEYVIPYGERLLTGIGIGSWSGAVDFENQENITYWSDNDYYNASSSDTLTILTNYKTRLQPTSWTCGLSSAISVLEWYGIRGTLNDYDLANLRGLDEWVTGTNPDVETHVFEELMDLGLVPNLTIECSTEAPDMIYDPEWILNHLSQGHPIMVDWNAFGGHWQVIIGYDTMGTEDTNDDVLIMMDPYDTTDQDANGYELESYERLAYGVSNAIDGGYTSIQYVVVYPEDWSYEPVMGEGIAEDPSNVADFTDANKMSYGTTAADIQTYYPDTEYLGENGLAAAAAEGYERSGDHNYSAYWKTFDFYKMTSTDTRKMLTNFQTIQQSTEWTCGLDSALMVMNWFGMSEGETDVSLATHRQNGDEGATYLAGMKEVFDYMNEEYDQDWVYVSTTDLDEPDEEESYIGDYCLQAGTAEDWYGLIPYLLENGIPVMIGSDEWGGHWQVIIGYDDMGTIDRTEDDVIILADSYDTTDHNQDGYYIDGFERLVYGWNSSFEEELKHNDFIAAFPLSQYAEVAAALGITE